MPIWSTPTAGVRQETEYELIDTGAFDEDRYFDVFVTYAKASPTDILIRIEVANRGPERRRCIYCQPSGFATPGHGKGAAPNPSSSLSRTRPKDHPRPSTDPLFGRCAGLHLHLRERTATAVYQKRDQ